MGNLKDGKEGVRNYYSTPYFNFSCSLDCWKEHRKIKCEPVPSPINVGEEGTIKHSQEYKYQTEDTVSLDRLKLLGTKIPHTIISNKR
jgi:hypothetical protein